MFTVADSVCSYVKTSMDGSLFYAYIYAMPKRPKFVHPVRAVRQAVGESLGKKLTQPAFARMVGVSAATIQSVELGRLALSPDLANRIFVLTGAEPRSLIKRGGKPRDW